MILKEIDFLDESSLLEDLPIRVVTGQVDLKMQSDCVRELTELWKNR